MVKRRRPPQWHLLFTAGGLLAAVVVAVSVSDLPSLPSQEESVRSANVSAPPPMSRDVASLRQGIETELDSFLSELGIVATAIRHRGRTPAGMDTVDIRVPADLPVASVNGAVTEFVQWRGGHIVRGAELRGPETVDLTVGIDSTVTTLFRLRRDRHLHRNGGNIAIIVDARGASVANVHRLTRLAQSVTLSGSGLPDREQQASDGTHQFVEAMPAGTPAIGAEPHTSAAVARHLWALAERAAGDGMASGSLVLAPPMLDALEQVLPRLERRGYRFVTLAELNR